MFKPKKELGQNFLQDSFFADLMVQTADLQTCPLVVEIGPGMGIVTSAILTKTPQVHLKAIELDNRLITPLRTMFHAFQNFEVINKNALDYFDSLEGYLADYNLDNWKILGSLPYHITSPLLHILIKMHVPPQTMVFLVQKEMASRICLQAPASSYLSVFVQTFYEAVLVQEVPRQHFRPIPQVDGAIIKLTKKPAVIPSTTIALYEKFLHQKFSSPRKKLNKVFTTTELARTAINPDLRPQNLSSQDFITSFKLLKLK